MQPLLFRFVLLVIKNFMNDVLGISHLVLFNISSESQRSLYLLVSL